MEIWNLLDSVAVLDISGYSLIDMLLVRISIFAELVKPRQAGLGRLNLKQALEDGFLPHSSCQSTSGVAKTAQR
jgi:hypothetical protein